MVIRWPDMYIQASWPGLLWPEEDADMVAGSRASCHRRQIGNQASEQLPVASPPSPMAIAEYADGKKCEKI